MKMLRHEHVVRYYGERKVEDYLYIFLEYADGGELFDRIGAGGHQMIGVDMLTEPLVFTCVNCGVLSISEPDLGMEPGLAHHFFKQLLLGVVCSS